MRPLRSRTSICTSCTTIRCACVSLCLVESDGLESDSLCCVAVLCLLPFCCAQPIGYGVTSVASDGTTRVPCFPHPLRALSCLLEPASVHCSGIRVLCVACCDTLPSCCFRIACWRFAGKPLRITIPANASSWSQLVPVDSECWSFSRCSALVALAGRCAAPCWMLYFARVSFV